MHRAFREREHVCLFSKYTLLYLTCAGGGFFFKDFFNFFIRFVEIPCTPTHTHTHSRNELRRKDMHVQPLHTVTYLHAWGRSVDRSVTVVETPNQKKYNLAKFAKTKTVTWSWRC